LSALIIIPIIYNNLSALWFEYIKIPEMETVRKEEVAQKLAEVNNKSFVPLAVHDYDVLLPGNVIIRLQKLMNSKISNLFQDIFEKEVIQKKKEVLVILGHNPSSFSTNPYTIVFTAGLNDTWLENGVAYRMIEGDLSLNSEIIDDNFILDEGGKYELKTMSAYFSVTSKELSDGSPNLKEYYVLPVNSLNGDLVKITILPSANCYDSSNKIIGCYQTIEDILKLYAGKNTIEYFEKDNKLNVVKIVFQNK